MEGVNVLQAGEAIENSLQLLAKSFRGVFDFSGVELKR